MANDKVKAFIQADAAAVSAVVNALEDGKITLLEVVAMIGPLTGVAAAVKDIKEVVEQWKNSTPAEQADTLAYARTVITFTNPKVESKVEAALGLVIYAGAFFADATVA